MKETRSTVLSLRGTTSTVALIVAIGGGCNEASGPASTGLTLTVTTSRSTAAPGEAILATVRAIPMAGHTVHWITISATGLVTMRDSVAVTGPGEHELSRTITLPRQPLTGTLTITGSANGGAKTASVEKTVDVLDGVAPNIILFEAEPLPAQPGDSTHFNYDVGDAVGVSRIRLRVDSAFTSERTITFAPSVQRAAGILKIKVPNDIMIDFGPRRAEATLTVSDESGSSREARLFYTIRDSRPPAAKLVLGGLRNDLTIGTGETVQVIVEATDNHQLTYVGYEGGGRRDSIAVSGSAATRAFPIVIQPEWRAHRPVFSVWARDLSGNLSPIGHEAVGTLPVFDWIEHPKTIIPFPNSPFPVDIVWDARRSVLYQLRSDLDRGINSVIDVIQVPSGPTVGTIAVGPAASGLNLTESGDSLITTLTEAKALGIVDLTSQSRTLSLLPLQHVNADQLPGTGRISGEHVFVPLRSWSSHQRVLDVNLATGAQTIRADIGGTADLTWYPVLLPLSGDRLLLNDAFLGNENHTFLYESSSNSFAPITPLPPVLEYNHFASSPSGRMVFGNKVFNGDFTELDSLVQPDWVGEFAKALSPDGETAYLATWHGYRKVRVSDSSLLEQVRLNTQPLQFLMLPDGKTLIVIGGLPGSNKGEWSVMVIDIR